jgi:hypothetical protein
MAEEWHKTPSEIKEQVSVTDMRRWRLLRIARWEASEKRSADYAKNGGKPAVPPMELDPDDLIDGTYLPNAEDDA